MSRELRKSIPGQFAPRLIEMLESPAYCVLSLSARRVLDRLEIELGHHGGKDNGRTSCHLRSVSGLWHRPSGDCPRDS